MNEGADTAAPPSELEKTRQLLSSTAIRALSEDRWQKWRPWMDWPLLLAFVGLITLLFVPFGPRVYPVPTLDSIATETVRAERDILVVDPRATTLRREAVVNSVLPVYNTDSELYFALGDKVFDAVRALATRKGEEVLDPSERRSAFEADLDRAVSAATFALIENLDSPTDAAVAITYFLHMALDRLVVAEREGLPTDRNVLVRNPSLGLTREVSPLNSVIDLQQLRRLMRARAGNVPYGDARIVRTWVLQTATAMARPNLVADEAATKERLDAALVAFEPVYVRIGSGEVVLREGDRVTPNVQERIRMLNVGAERRTIWGEPAAFAALLSGLIVLGAFFFRRARQPLRLGRKACYLALTVVATTTLICVASFHAGRGLADGIGFGAEWAAYLMPVALATVLISLLVDSRTSLLAGVGMSLLASYRADGDMWLVTYFVVGVLVAGVAIRHCKRRSDLLKTGIAISLSQAAAVPVILVLSGSPLDGQHLSLVFAALGSGVIMAISVLGLMPLLEYAFNETTDMRLMEMASADNRLLKELAVHSPGTYFHSVVMGNLAEAAADAVGANALQCRVMALYHDIGKVRRPSYFAENQKSGNIHDRLPPELSARIIFAHIKDGIDIAVKHRLGRPVMDAITQHQGTTLLKTFYAKAAEQAKAEGLDTTEAEFRYPGPRPMSKESGILMAADAVEAATRALKDPSPADIRERIRKVIGDRMTDGQFDHCQLTLKDLAAMEEAFIRVLTLGVYHTRVEYPLMPHGDAKGNHDERAGHSRVHTLHNVADRSS